MRNVESIHNNLVATLTAMDKICGELEIFKSVPTHGPWKAYLYERRAVASDSSVELIIIPDGKGTDLDAAIDDMRSAGEVPGRSQFMFVDCFDKYGKEISKRGDIIDPATFWQRMSGAADYGSRLEDDHDASDIEQNFLNRKLVQIKVNVDGNVYRDSIAHRDMDLLREWAELPPVSNNLLIVGERGSGKTWILKKFAREQWDRHKEDPWHSFPALFLNLKDYAESLLRDQGIRKSLSYFLCKQAKFKSAGEIYFWEALIESGRAILLLDGFDELSRETTDVDMRHHVEMLSSYLPQKCKAVISTRGTVFPSLRRLYDVFTGQSRKRTPDAAGGGTYVESPQSGWAVQVHDLYTIAPFVNDDFVMLASKSTSAGPLDDQHLKERVQSLVSVAGTEDEQFVARQCLELATIPAIAYYLLGMLKDDDDYATYLRLYEAALIGPLVSYNLRTGRAIGKFRVQKKEGTESRDIGLNAKVEVLEYIAWYLLESGRSDFDSTYLGEVAIDIPNTGFNAVVNDLRSQTVFEFSQDSRDLQFRLKTIHAYFVARYLFTRLTDPSRMESGIKCLGRHNFDAKDAIAGFLRLFFAHGMLSLRDLDEFTFFYDEDIHHIDAPLLEQKILQLLADQPGYSVWTRCLSKNLSSIGFSAASIDKSNEWHRSPLVLGSESELEEAVLVAGDVSLDPFLIACREEKNADFEKFLSSPRIPALRLCSDVDVTCPPDMKWEVVFPKNEGSRSANDHPLSWNAIHRGSKEEGKSFYALTNDYHLLEAIEDGNFPSRLLDHPVTWVGVYVIAIYCNWKTLENKQSESDQYYRIFLGTTGKPCLVRIPNEHATGFRLPTVKEWHYAARAEDEGRTPWESLLGTERGKRLRDYLLAPLTTTRSVWSNYFNEFGIYGMIGNVREWADNGATLSEPDPKFSVLGATWRLGEETFAYGSAGGELSLPNTNLDVGFRWARSLPPEIVQTVQRVQRDKNTHRRGS